jgi:hypothetical protein
MEKLQQNQEALALHIDGSIETSIRGFVMNLFQNARNRFDSDPGNSRRIHGQNTDFDGKHTSRMESAPGAHLVWRKARKLPNGWGESQFQKTMPKHFTVHSMRNLSADIELSYGR